MTIITIPKQFIKQRELVVIPKTEYEEFSLWKKTIKVRLDERWFWTPEWQKKEAEADLAIRTGKTKGPFSNYKKLISALKTKKNSS